MNINYNVSGSDRKRLVAAIAEYNSEKPKYLGAPSFAYQVGTIHISVDGIVTTETISEATPLIRYLREKGFRPKILCRIASQMRTRRLPRNPRILKSPAPAFPCHGCCLPT